MPRKGQTLKYRKAPHSKPPGMKRRAKEDDPLGLLRPAQI